MQPCGSATAPRPTVAQYDQQNHRHHPKTACAIDINFQVQETMLLTAPPGISIEEMEQAEISLACWPLTVFDHG
jgi:hypothetical protein